ncbi:MAG TPA: hypothetical protein VKA84_07080 [Gemmatimonadaceae bacterium]|nr:hypothetical protein [Gemmatimonadaceae bacterium]
MRASTAITLISAAVLSTACAHTTHGPAAERRPSPARDYNRIGFAEIVSLRSQAYVATAYDIVERIRPMYLHSRAVTFTGGDGPVVYVDNLYIGGPAALRQIDSRSVQEIRYGWGDGMIAKAGRAPNARVIYVVTAR